MDTTQPCPECQQGKHSNCDGTTWDNHTDQSAPCPCPHRTHRAGRGTSAFHQQRPGVIPPTSGV